ncbi:MAG TPA: hypothetical protein VFZ74_04505 [Burkholderiales bacterium]
MNPHSGEFGHLGTEDRDVIAPSVEYGRLLGRLAGALCYPVSPAQHAHITSSIEGEKK